MDAARIVIIGGGIVGCSIAYHLAQMGVADVVLLDKGELTSGSTWHAAGMVTHFHTSPTLMRMRQYSIRLYRHLQAVPGAVEHWHEVGSVRVASSRDQFRFLQRQVGMARAIGLEVDTISAAAALRLCPFMSPHDLHGAMHLPGDGYLDPSGVTLELARHARRAGVSLRTGVRVTGIERTGRGAIARVLTENGPIQTECVINAAGMWAKQVGAMVDVGLPVTPLLHQHLTVKPIAGSELPRHTPCLRDPENLVYMREEVGGFLVGGFEKEPAAWSVGGVPWDFTQALLPPDWNLFAGIMEGALRRVPLLATAEVAHLVNGPEGITPDSRPLLGPVPGVPGFWVAAGLSHTGFGAGGAIGHVLAEWLVEGQPTYDVTELNVRRFGPVYADTAYAAARARESYKYYYALRYPDDENESLRGRRLSPLDSRLAAAGAVFGEKNGWERANYFAPGTPGRRAGAEQGRWGWRCPAFFAAVAAEHCAVRERVALFDFTSFGKIDIAGPGALAFLQRLADNDIDRPVGSVIYTQFLNQRGGIESDVTVTRWGPDSFRVTTGSNFVARDLGWIRMHMPDDGSVDVREVTDDFACIGLWGPGARRTLMAVTAADGLTNEAFPYMSARVIEVAGIPVHAQRVTYVGELGWELYTPPHHAELVWDALLTAGRPFDIRPAGYKAVESLRLEKGYRYWSSDITPAENPFEAGLGFCVRLTKGDFIGRSALLQAKEVGLSRRLCTLAVTASAKEVALYGGEAVYVGSRVIGRLRSAGYGHTVARHIGLVYLPLDLIEPGTALEVEVFGKRLGATVTRDALYDPHGIRLRAE